MFHTQLHDLSTPKMILERIERNDSTIINYRYSKLPKKVLNFWLPETGKTLVVAIEQNSGMNKCPYPTKASSFRLRLTTLNYAII